MGYVCLIVISGMLVFGLVCVDMIGDACVFWWLRFLIWFGLYLVFSCVVEQV